MHDEGRLSASAAAHECHHLGGGSGWERLPDLEDPLDPRYRDEVWTPAPLPQSLADLPASVDAATKEGRLSTPLSHLLSMIAFGVEECHYRSAV